MSISTSFGDYDYEDEEEDEISVSKASPAAKSKDTSALTRSSDRRTASESTKIDNSSQGAGGEWVIHPIFGAMPPEPTPGRNCKYVLPLLKSTISTYFVA